MMIWTNSAPCPPLMFSEVQDSTTYTAISDGCNPGDAIYDFWYPLLPRDERDILGAENECQGKFGHPPFLDPVMSTTYLGISKANIGYRQSNNFFRKMIEEL